MKGQDVLPEPPFVLHLHQKGVQEMDTLHDGTTYLKLNIFVMNALNIIIEVIKMVMKVLLFGNGNGAPMVRQKLP